MLIGSKLGDLARDPSSQIRGGGEWNFFDSGHNTLYAPLEVRPGWVRIELVPRSASDPDGVLLSGTGRYVEASQTYQPRPTVVERKVG